MKALSGLARFGLAIVLVVVAIALARAYLVPSQTTPASWQAGPVSDREADDADRGRAAPHPTILQPTDAVTDLGDVPQWEQDEWDQDRDSQWQPYSEDDTAVADEPAETTDADVTPSDELPPPRDTFPQ